MYLQSLKGRKRGVHSITTSTYNKLAKRICLICSQFMDIKPRSCNKQPTTLEILKGNDVGNIKKLVMRLLDEHIKTSNVKYADAML